MVLTILEKNFMLGSLKKKHHLFLMQNMLASSGTAAIKCALKALGVKKDDEVITQGFNFIATVRQSLIVEQFLLSVM